MPIKDFKITKTAEHSRSMADYIYESLRLAIVTGELPPGNRLLEKEVADYFNLSRTPVREAFRRLEQDYMVERVAQGGVKVVDFDHQTIHDLFNVRSVLEAYSIELACDRITPEQLAFLKELRAQAYEILNSTDLSREYTLKRIFELNSMFHEKIYESSGSPFLIRILRNLGGIVQGMRKVSIQAEKSATVSWAEHSALIGHLEKREKKEAVELIKRHVASAEEQVISVKEKNKQFSPNTD